MLSNVGTSLTLEQTKMKRYRNLCFTMKDLDDFENFIDISSNHIASSDILDIVRLAMLGQPICNGNKHLDRYMALTAKKRKMHRMRLCGYILDELASS